MTDSKPRKTLTLARKTITKADAGPNGEAAERRKRSGARARQVAQLQREQNKSPSTTEPAPKPFTGRGPVQDRGGQAAPTASRPPRPHAGTPSAGTPARSELRQPRSQWHGETRARPQSPQEERSRSRHHEDVEIVRRPGARRQRTSRGGEVFQVFAPCPRGLEDALHAELQALGYEALRKDRAGCHFQADWTGVLKANLYSRLATRILVRLAHAPVRNEDDILALAHDTEWERWFGPEQTLRVDTSAIRSPMQSLQYCNLRVKDGICDRLRDREGARPDIDTVRPDARVHQFLDEDTATLYLDTSGESLFKRGWRLDKGEAPLRENLAAGLIALAEWDPEQPLMDTFCGSGTILIEAAWIALGVPPGIWRPFGFERLRDHDARHWRDIKDEARSRIATQLDAPLFGYDIDPAAVAAAQANQERAKLSPDTIRFAVADAREVRPPSASGWMVTNPPYGERMEHDPAFWSHWAENLKRHYAGWHVNVITSDLDLPSHLRLKPKRRFPVFNGALDCRMFVFDMVEREYRRN